MGTYKTILGKREMFLRLSEISETVNTALLYMDCMVLKPHARAQVVNCMVLALHPSCSPRKCTARLTAWQSSESRFHRAVRSRKVIFHLALPARFPRSVRILPNAYMANNYVLTNFNTNQFRAWLIQGEMVGEGCHAKVVKTV